MVCRQIFSILGRSRKAVFPDTSSNLAKSLEIDKRADEEFFQFGFPLFVAIELNVTTLRSPALEIQDA